MAIFAGQCQTVLDSIHQAREQVHYFAGRESQAGLLFQIHQIASGPIGQRDFELQPQLGSHSMDRQREVGGITRHPQRLNIRYGSAAGYMSPSKLRGCIRRGYGDGRRFVGPPFR